MIEAGFNGGAYLTLRTGLCDGSKNIFIRAQRQQNSKGATVHSYEVKNMLNKACTNLLQD